MFCGSRLERAATRAACDLATRPTGAGSGSPAARAAAHRRPGPATGGSECIRSPPACQRGQPHLHRDRQARALYSQPAAERLCAARRPAGAGEGELLPPADQSAAARGHRHRRQHLDSLALSVRAAVGHRVSAADSQGQERPRLCDGLRCDAHGDAGLDQQYRRRWRRASTGCAPAAARRCSMRSTRPAATSCWTSRAARSRCARPWS